MKNTPYALFICLFYLIQHTTVNAQCTADAGPDQVLTCTNTTVMLTGASNVANPEYAWSGPGGYTSALPNPIVSAPGVYALTVTDSGNGCSATDEVIVNQDIVTPSISLQATAACNNDGAVMTNTASGLEFLWSNGDTAASAVNLLPGVYCVTVADPNNGCFTEGCATVAQLEQAIVGSSQANPFNGTNSGAIALTPIPLGTQMIYQWTGPNNFTSDQPTINNLGPGDYTVTVTNITSGCSSVYTFKLVAVYLPLQVAVALCDNEVTFHIQGPPGPYIIAWPGGSQMGNNPNPSIFLPPGNYSVTITDSTSSQSTTKSVTVPPNFPPCTYIEGNISYDTNGNCKTDPGEPGLGSWVAKAESLDDIYYGVTDLNGHYKIRVPPGSYLVDVLPKTDSAQVCEPHWPVFNLQQGQSRTVNFTVAGAYLECPALSVALGTPILRRCFNNNFYYLFYCNNSPNPVPDAYIDLTLDPFLQIQNASAPYTDLGNNTIRFNPGTIEPSHCGDIWIRIAVSCDAILGQTHCSEAHIYPDSLCEPVNPDWSGALVEVTSACTGDSLHFILKNTGTAPMTQSLDYIVIEDGMLGLQQSAPPLAAGDVHKVSLPANGSTWRIEAQQEPLAPTYFQPVLSVEGCVTTGAFSTGFVNQFPTNDSAPWIDVDCSPNVGAYDPNDKQGFSEGYGASHYIRPGTEIEYRIRFQNTGTDTAFNVVIRDTLSEWLDPASIQPGPGSHPYQFELTGRGILVFDFQNILLPDSNKNEALSHGFVQYRIRTKDVAPLETDIPNRAAIYFDYNDPVLTNTTLHRTGENFVSVGLWRPMLPAYRIQVAPHPLQEASWVELEGGLPVLSGVFSLRIFDLAGRPVRNMESAEPRFLLQKNELPEGSYLFLIENAGKRLGSGKLIVR